MTRRQIAYFLGVAECLSFSRAAERLHVAQSALSARIGELERLLGQSLFERHARGVSLTEAGKALLPHAREIEAAFERASQAVVTSTRAPMKTVQIGVTPSVGATFLPVLLETAAGFDPEVDWQVQQTISVTLVEMLGRGDIHAALCYLKVTSALVRSMKLYSEEMLLIGRHEVLGEDNGDIAFADLVRFKFVLDPKINPRRQLVDAAMARTGTELQMQAEIEPVSAKRILVRDKGLCAILPRHLFAPELADGSCTARRIVSPRLPLTLYLLLGKGIDGRLSAFIRSSSAAAAARMVKSRPS